MEWFAGWDQAVWELNQNGLDQAHTIINYPHDAVYNAYISGKRAAAELAIQSGQMPLKSSFL
jgi:hypothetical protein